MFNITDENVIYLTRGDSADFKINVYTIGGNEYEIKDTDTITFTLKRSTSDKENLFQKTGNIIRINPNDTKDLSYGEYVYDVQLNFDNGDVDTIIEPTRFYVTEEVTF